MFLSSLGEFCKGLIVRFVTLAMCRYEQMERVVFLRGCDIYSSKWWFERVENCPLVAGLYRTSCPECLSRQKETCRKNVSRSHLKNKKLKDFERLESNSWFMIFVPLDERMCRSILDGTWTPEWRIPQVTHIRSHKQQSYLMARDSSKIGILSVTAYTQSLRMDFEDLAHVSNSLP